MTLFLHFKLLKININIYFSALLIYKCLNNSLDNNFFHIRTNERYRFRVNYMLEIPQVQSNQSQTCITYYEVKIWNQLPLYMKTKATLNSFKHALKKFLLTYYQQ